MSTSMRKSLHLSIGTAGIRGVRLGKELMGVAANGLKLNMTRLGPLVLPLSEQLLFAGNMVARMLLGPKQVKPYVPDFGLAFDHICLHTGVCPWNTIQSTTTQRPSANCIMFNTIYARNM